MNALPNALDPVLLRALADPTRLEILGVLIAAGGQANVGAIASHVAVDGSVVSRHLTELARAGVLASERRGRQRWYSLEIHRLIAHFAEITRQLEAVRDGLPCC